MADKNDKYPDNAPGKFYVDRECIFCNVCVAAAPKNFKISDDGTHDVVYKQPENEEEEGECLEAMDMCPVYAIGDDGEE